MIIEEINESHLKGFNNLLNSIMDEDVFTVNIKKTIEERIKWFNNSYLKSRLKNNHITFVAVKDNLIIGSASAIRQQGKRQHVFEIGYQVLKNYRQQGVATILVNKLINFIKNSKAEQVIAWVTENNIKSVYFLKKFGFKEVGRINKGVKLKKGYCDYLLFQKEL